MSSADSRQQATGAAGDYIPHSRPDLGDAELAAVAAVLESGQLAQSTQVEALEREVTRTIGYADSPPGVAVSSGTAALLVALRALEVGPGDEVLIPAYACTSLNQAVLFAGATPVYVDADPETLNPDPEDARRKATPNTAACIVPHLFGRPAPIDEFVGVAPKLVEDCAQTLGVDYNGAPVGGTGDVTICSFYATKLVAGGEGGMVLSRDPATVARARDQRDCEANGASGEAFNFKLSDLHAAIARVQLERLPGFIERRTELAAGYRAALADAKVTLPPDDRAGENAWFRFVVQLDDGRVEEVIAAAEALGLACRQPVGTLVGGVDLDALPGCKAAWNRACSIPLYPAMSDDEARQAPERFLATLKT